MAENLRRNPNAQARGIGALVVQALLSLSMTFLVFMQTFRVAGCGDACDYGLVNGAWIVQLWVGPLVLLASIAAVVVLSRKAHESWWAVGIGAALVISVGLVNIIALNIAT
ncbi:hypothetical protein AB0N61_16620 [Microbacterium sp. NPDC089320]|uniref:hypothetical protein n=1 Tax=Microbacterium sp. NPDC089320 TaxID=3155182 RepID=UPI003427DEB3